MNRSIRIHKKQVQKEKIRKRRLWRNKRFGDIGKKEDIKLLGIETKTQTLCSCAMCRNKNIRKEERISSYNEKCFIEELICYSEEQVFNKEAEHDSPSP